ncbi:MAG: ATP-binding protein [Myxococcota bacterium]
MNGTVPCSCTSHPSPCPRVAITGGPGAGKTAALEVVRRELCQHVAVLPEAATVLFRGGFPRGASSIERRAAQRAIYYVQRELERQALELGRSSVVLCDRGTLDGVAYWPGDGDAFLAEVGTTRERELAAYDVVIHLRTPGAHHGYNHTNHVRTESADEARALDELILAVWAAHPRRFVIEASATFTDKLARTLAIIHDVVPACCRAREARRA